MWHSVCGSWKWQLVIRGRKTFFCFQGAPEKKRCQKINIHGAEGESNVPPYTKLTGGEGGLLYISRGPGAEVLFRPRLASRQVLARVGTIRPLPHAQRRCGPLATRPYCPTADRMARLFLSHVTKKSPPFTNFFFLESFFTFPSSPPLSPLFLVKLS